MTSDGSSSISTHEQLAAWLAQQGIESPVPRHLRSSLESDGGSANCRTRGCNISSDLAYSTIFAIIQAVDATEDFFLSGSRSNGYATFWGFACRSANVLVVMQLSSDRLDDGTSTYNSRMLRLYNSLALPMMEQPSVGSDLDAYLVLSNFRHSGLALDPRTPRDPNDSGSGVLSAIDDPRQNVQVLASLLAATRNPT